MAQEESKWYNSTLAEGVGFSAVILALAFGGKYCCGPNEADIKLERAKRGYVRYERDLNNNGVAEQFCEIEGTKYFSAIDGKNLEDSLK